MTREEAIKRLKIDKLGDLEVDRIAKNMAIEALKKQVPMKPTVQNEDEYVVNYKCPKCECRFVSKIDGEFVAGMRYPYCFICGQRIDWEGVK